MNWKLWIQGMCVAIVMLMVLSATPVQGLVKEHNSTVGAEMGSSVESSLMMVYPPIGMATTWQLDLGPVLRADGSSGGAPKYIRIADWIGEQLLSISIEPVVMYDYGVLIDVTEEDAALIRSLGLYTSSIPPSDLVSRNGIRMTLEAKNRLTPPKGISGAYLIAFVGPIKREWLDILEGDGVSFESFIPNYAYVARIPYYSLKTVFSHPFVRAVLPWDTQFKISERLLQLETKAPVRIYLLSDSDIDVFLQFAIEQNTEVVSWSDKWGRFVDVIADGALAKDLAAHKDVFLIDIQEVTESVFLNDQARWVIQSGVSGSTPIHDHDIRGQFDIITNGPGLVTMADSGLDEGHQDFYDTEQIGPTHRKVEDYYFWPGMGDDQDNLGHGTHVGGTVLGDSPPYDDYSFYDGHAFGARIIVQDIGPGVDGPFPPWPYGLMFEPAHDAGSRIHTNSWGAIAQHGSYYGVRGQMIDDFVWQTEWRDFVILFAAGNQFNMITQQSEAKNMISVGATENARPPLDPNNIWMGVGATGSGRGPTGDGRLKPNVLAPGNEVISALSGEASPTWCWTNPVDNFYVPCTGTSMATPAVAGSAQLVRQYFSEGWYPQGIPIEANGFNPSSALVRAMLVNSADEITGARTDEIDYCRPDLSYCFEYPDNNQGWGRVNLDNVMYFSDDPEPQRRLFAVDEEIGLATSQYVEYVVEIADTTVPFEATLVWTDPMGALQCDPCLVNNLDLLVIDPLGNQYRGNVFDEEGGSWQSKTNPIEPQDPYNVEEAVLRYSPAVGLWTIRIIGASIPYTSAERGQPFALVVTGAISDETRQTYSSAPSFTTQVTTDQDGNAHVVWLEDLGSGTPDWEIFYKKVDFNGKTIMGPEQVTTANDNIDGDRQWSPRVITSGTSLFVFFANLNDAPPRTHYLDGKKRSIHGGIWTDIEMRDPSSDRFLLFRTTDPGNTYDISDFWYAFDVDVNLLGIIVIAYAELDRQFSGGSDIEYESILYTQSQDSTGETWEYASPVFADGGYDYLGCDHTKRLSSPGIAVGGLVSTNYFYRHVIYSYDDTLECLGGGFSGNSYVRYARSENMGLTWNPDSFNIGNTNDVGRESALEADDIGGVYATWHDWFDGFDVFMNYNHNDGDTSSWAGESAIFDGPNCQVYPDIRLGARKELHLVFAESLVSCHPIPTSEYEIMYSASLDRAVTWHGAQRITFAQGMSYYPTIDVYQGGDPLAQESVYLAWADQRTGNGEIFVQTLPRDKRVTHSTWDSETPWVTVDSNDNSHIIWIDERDGESEVYYTRLDSYGRHLSGDFRFPDIVNDAGDRQFAPIITVSSATDAIFVFFANEDELGLRTYFIDGWRSDDGGNMWTRLDMLEGSINPIILWKSVFPTDDVTEYYDTWHPFDVDIDDNGIIHIVHTSYIRSSNDVNEYVSYVRSLDALGDRYTTVQTLAGPLHYLDPGYDHTRMLWSPNVAVGRTVGPLEYRYATYSLDWVIDPIDGPYIGPSEINLLRSTDNGNNWVPVSSGNPLAFTTERARESDLVAARIGSVGAVVATWNDNVMGLHKIYTRRTVDDGFTWDPAVFVDVDFPLHTPSTTLDSELVLHIASVQFGTNPSIRHLISRDLGFTWGEPAAVVLSRISPGSSDFPVIVVNNSDRLNVVWQSSGGNSQSWTEVYYSWYL